MNNQSQSSKHNQSKQIMQVEERLNFASNIPYNLATFPRKITTSEEIKPVALPKLPIVKPFVPNVIPYPMPTPRSENPNRTQINATATKIKFATKKIMAQRSKIFKQEPQFQPINNKQQQKSKQAHSVQAKPQKAAKRKSCQNQELVKNPMKKFKCSSDSESGSTGSN